MAEKVDVLICGSGSAGLCAAAWLARYGIRCKILERSEGPLQIGQADGVQCRTVEIFESFGLSAKLLHEAYHVKEVAFWNVNDKGTLARTGVAPDTPTDISHQPHLILNQARVNGMMLELMQEYNDQQVDYDWNVTHVDVDSALAGDLNAYPITAKAVKKNGREATFHAKYLFGSDGAHSQVRHSLGFKMIGDSTNHVWGVMDTWPDTDFPDIRKKCAVRTDAGNILIIPREDETMVRLYVDLGTNTDPKKVTREDLYRSAKRIFAPYKIDFRDTYWWSAYSIGQRRADFFHKDYRAFLAGDACHTHSPKAGQGMNVSLQDGYNFGWKVASVLKGISTPNLLETYVLERQKVAQDLIDFDRYWAKLWSERDSDKADGSGQDFSEAFKKAGKFMAGIMAHYSPSIITLDSQSRPNLAEALTPGMRFPSTMVCRMSDANPVQLNEAMPSDTRWRLVVFGGDLNNTKSASKVRKLADYLTSSDSPVSKYTPRGADLDALIDPLLILSGKRLDVEPSDVPDYFKPITGKRKLRDRNKVYFDDEMYLGYGIKKAEAYDFYQIDPVEGALVIVRPDGYVASILSLDDYATIGSFFDGFLVPRPEPLTITAADPQEIGTLQNVVAVGA